MCGCIGELKTRFSFIFHLKLLQKWEKKSFFSQVQRAQIFTLHKEGYSERKICVKLHFNKIAVHSAIENVQNYDTFSDMGKSERLRKTSIRDNYMMKHIATRSPSSSCKAIRAALLAIGRNVSLMIVLRYLSNELSLKSHKQSRKPRLITAMKFKCLDFVKKYEDWIAERLV